MKTVFIDLSSLDRVKEFESDICKLEGDFDLISGKYIVDAKSMMGIFSLDLTSPIQMNIYQDTEDKMKVLDKYII